MTWTMLGRHARGAVLVLALAGALLQGCGGGGGAGGGDAGGDGGGGNGGGGGTLSGRLWHTDYAFDYRDGAQIASLSGALPAQVTADLPAWPWADGSQYLTADASALDSTDVRVYELATGTQHYHVEFEGYLREVRPSPVSKSVILATWGEDSISTAYVLFYDLAAGRVLDLFERGDAAVDWLPDGRYLRVAADGGISVGTVGGGTSASGAFTVPPGRELERISVSPNGAQVLLRLVVRAQDGSIDESDLWLAQADGSGLKRFTTTRITSHGQWSPDSSRVAFDADTGLVCGGFSCTGSCELWHGKASAQNLTALVADDDQGQFSAKNRNGTPTLLGCELQSWTK